MKKIFSLLTLVSAIFLTSVHSFARVSAAGPPMPEENISEEVLYDVNFDTFSAGDTDIFPEQPILWYENSNVAPLITDQLALEFEALIQSEYLNIGGIGSGLTDNLSELVTNSYYSFEMDIDLSSTTDGAGLFVEYQNDTHGWTGLELFKDGSMALLNNGNNLYEISYESNKLALTFKAGVLNNGDKSWIKLTGHHINKDDLFYLDNITIKDTNTTFIQDFQKYSDNADGLVDNIYYGGDQFSGIINNVSGNKQLLLSNETDHEVWKSFFVNSLNSSLSASELHRLSFDLIYTGGLMEFYIHYYGNWGPTNHSVTYYLNKTVNVPVSNYLKGANYVGNRVSVDFIPDSTLGWDWGQLMLIFKANSNFTLSIDNIVIEKLVDVTSVSVDTSNVKTTYFVDDQLSLDNLKVFANTNKATSYQLPLRQYVVDLSLVDVTTAGVYEVTVAGINKQSTRLEDTFNITVVPSSYKHQFSEVSEGSLGDHTFSDVHFEVKYDVATEDVSFDGVNGLTFEQASLVRLTSRWFVADEIDFIDQVRLTAKAAIGSTIRLKVFALNGAVTQNVAINVISNSLEAYIYNLPSSMRGRIQVLFENVAPNDVAIKDITINGHEGGNADYINALNFVNQLEDYKTCLTSDDVDAVNALEDKYDLLSANALSLLETIKVYDYSTYDSGTFTYNLNEGRDIFVSASAKWEALKLMAPDSGHDEINYSLKNANSNATLMALLVLISFATFTFYPLLTKYKERH